ncbi:MAG: DNA repair protein RecO [Coriobacteriia bacterium]|nr:DNA repair protein RecO [Coriobacteriia bacterium]
MARSYTAQVLVLAKTKLGETDLILTLLSSENSQIRAVAKGARKPGAKLCGLSEPFTVFDAKFHAGKSLDIVQEARAVESYASIRENYNCLIAGSVALELATLVTDDGDTILRLYAMTRAFLDALSIVAADENEQQLHLLLAAYLLKAMAMIGYSPEYELCAQNPELADLLRSTFAQLAKSHSGDNLQASKRQLRQTISFTEKHLPAPLKSLIYYKKSM